MICKTCQSFGHTVKYCKSEVVVCGRCNKGNDHETMQCNSRKMECHHCQREHLTSSRNCEQYKYEMEIPSIQSKEKVSKRQAAVIFKQRNGNCRMNFANEVKGTCKTTKNRAKTSQGAQVSVSIPNTVSREVV